MGLFDISSLQLGFQVLYATVLEENLTSRVQQRFTITLFRPLAKLQRLRQYSYLELPFVVGNLKVPFTTTVTSGCYITIEGLFLGLYSLVY